MKKTYTIKAADWDKDKTALSSVRRTVFVEEQKVPEELEWDEFDEISQHVLALDHSGNPIGTGRIKADGQIGRMAVLNDWRNKGVGQSILDELLKLSSQSIHDEIYLHAQLSAIKFYEKSGFIINSDEFIDAGIPHKTMIKRIDNT